ncbi:Putative vitellogenin receptor [Araneus ventricosus]|uniref:Vitellogenin receptor n=1 Tax=Araneus ventricosus TaxID=182803 RepID=A0A4Y2HF52_ARAVE|nr:Putative vitellogenin receptor [Araneus ventricosus]
MNRPISLELFLISFVAGGFLHYAVASIPCISSVFKCTSGECIYRNRFCDGTGNCRDYSDEKYCDIDSSVFCPPGWIRCPSGDRCILSHWICDGVTDCGEISEERNCDYLTCTPSLFKCMNERCIPRSWFCDGKIDCGNNYDERYCDVGPESLCPAGWIRCPSMNRCILSHWNCDGVTDCTGVSEEINCGKNTSKIPDNTTAEDPYISTALMQDTTTAKKELKSWILQRRKKGSGTDRWGSQVHRIAVALHLADNSTFESGNRTGEEIRYELTIKLLQHLAKYIPYRKSTYCNGSHDTTFRKFLQIFTDHDP